MTSLTRERSWLLDRNLLKLVYQCRRLIRSEFGEQLHLTEEHLEQHLADYAGKSSSQTLVDTWECLLAQVPELRMKTEEHSKKIYRGMDIIDDTDVARITGSGQEADLSRKKKIIYRGQVLG
jgi:hypothetical protein